MTRGETARRVAAVLTHDENCWCFHGSYNHCSVCSEAGCVGTPLGSACRVLGTVPPAEAAVMKKRDAFR